MKIKRGDTKPNLVIDIDNDQGNPVDLTAATAVHVVCRGAAEFTNTAPSVDRPNGQVTHLWQTSQTDTAGRILAEVVVTWPDGATQTFPANSFVAVDVVESLR